MGAVTIFSSFGAGSGKIGVTHIPFTKKERWEVAREWCNSKVARKLDVTCPLSVHDHYFVYDGQGYFAPQKKTWIDALYDLGKL